MKQIIFNQKLLVAAQLLGFDGFIPSYASARGEDILKGVNYASGGGGILNETARNNLVIQTLTLQNSLHQESEQFNHIFS